MTDLRVLVFDIETFPLTVRAWRSWKVDHVLEVVEDFKIASVAWKWIDLEKGPTPGGVKAASIPEWTDDMTDDSGVVKTVLDLLDEADIVIGHNIKRFDVKKVQARALVLDTPPPSPFKAVDTLQICKREFALTSNRLGDVCEAFGIGGKYQTGGYDLWKGCMAGDEASWRKMVRYNKGDVLLNERLYFKLQAWDAYAPNLGLMTDRPDACPKCGATRNPTDTGPALISRGRPGRSDGPTDAGTPRFRYAGVTKRRSFQCTRCHGYCSGRAIIKSDVHRVT